MNGKFEEKLTRLAFGEITPEEAARLEQEAKTNPEALRTLTLYREMRAGLRDLAEIPDDQFSKERLRDAILMQGLKPRPPRPVSNRTWLWMPFAACALGFGLMYLRQSNRQTPLVLNGMDAAIKRIHSDTSLDIPTKSAPEPTRVVLNDRSAAPLGPFLPSTRGKDGLFNRHGSRHHKDPNEVDPNLVAWYDPYEAPYAGDPEVSAPSVPTVADYSPRPVGAATGGNAQGGPGAFGAGIGGGRSSARDANSSSGEIVLIQQEKDEQTGAQKATEVSSASNVSVSG